MRGEIKKGEGQRKSGQDKRREGKGRKEERVTKEKMRKRNSGRRNGRPEDARGRTAGWTCQPLASPRNPPPGRSCWWGSGAGKGVLVELRKK